MPILHPTVENPDELLAWPASDGPINRIQLERSATGGGTGFSNIGSITITAGTRFYTHYDGAGTATDWYRWYVSNAGNTFPSSSNRIYSDEQQPGAEAGSGQLCSLHDVKQRMGLDESNTDEDESILEFIGEVSIDIMGYTHREFVPFVGTRTFDIGRASPNLWIPKGIRSVTTLGYATSSQPDTGGSYTALTAADFHLRPLTHDRSRGWPATRIELDWLGALRSFFPGHSTVQITGSFGWAEPPADIAGIAASAVTRRFLGKESAATLISLGPEGGIRLLNDISPAMQAKLDWYRWQAVA